MEAQQNFVSRIWKNFFPSKSTKGNLRISENHTKQYVDRLWENKAKNTYKSILVSALNRFAQKHRASTKKVNKIVDDILLQNEKNILRWMETPCIYIPIKNSANVSRKNTNFYLRRIVIDTTYVHIDYAVFVPNRGEITHTEKFNR